MASQGKPTTRRYSAELKARAVRMVRALREETGEQHGSVKRVADQLDIGVESLRTWVRRDEVDNGEAAGTTSAEAERIRALEQENRELRRANAILKSASAFFAAELCATRRRVDREVVRDHFRWAVAAA